jgi:hypothetical protein
MPRLKARPLTHLPGADQRLDLRFDKVFTVHIESELFGDQVGVARNLSAGGMFVELADPPPLGAVIDVRFPGPDGSTSLAFRGEVKHHFCWNYQRGDEPAQARGIGLRFTEFVEEVDALYRDSFGPDRVRH